MKRLKSVANRLFHRDRTYEIGAAKLRLPSDHGLPRYQARFPTYDAFLPILACHLPKASMVVDVGANVGDTIAGMAAVNSNLVFVAVEPSDDFLPYLAINLEELRKVYGSLDVEIVKAFVSNNLAIGGMEGKAGTRRAIVGDTSISSAIENIMLDGLANRFSEQAISLVKVDTDGFDWSVIASGRQLFATRQPLLFFETELGSAFEHFANYVEEIRFLGEGCGYRFTLFDNFGVPVVHDVDAPVATQLLGYLVSSQATNRKAIFYFDILAAPQSQAAIVQAALGDWSRKFGLASPDKS